MTIVMLIFVPVTILSDNYTCAILFILQRTSINNIYSI